MQQAEAQGFARARGEHDGSAAVGSIVPVDVIVPLDAVQSPPPGLTQPTCFQFSPTGDTVTCLWSADGTLTRHLYAADVTHSAVGEVTQLAARAGVTGNEAQLSLEEQLRRERARERGLGVTSYCWARTAGVYLLPDPGNQALYVSSVGDCKNVRAIGSREPRLDPLLSPDGNYVAYIHAGDIMVASAAPGKELHPPVSVTTGASENVTRGLADFIAQEELHRPMGMWWAADSSAIAFCEVDTTPVARFRIAHFDENPASEEVHAYPFAGANNAIVRLGVTRAAESWDSGAPPHILFTDVLCGPGHEWEYLCRVRWHSDSLLVQVMDRGQKRLCTLRVSASTGKTEGVVHIETSSTWINLCDDHDALRGLPDGRVLLTSERSGHRHVYIADKDGVGVAAVTSGAWSVDAVPAVGQENSAVYFLASVESPLERHLYKAPIPLDDGAPPAQPVRLTHERGWHSVVVDTACTRFIDTHDAPDRPPTVTLRSCVDGAALCVLFVPQSPMPHRALRLGLTPPQHLEFTAADGVTTLHGMLFMPTRPGADGRPPPLVVSVYGGPHVQMVAHNWMQTVDMRAQMLRSRGFAVLKLDSRGSARRGRAFEDSLFRAMGSVELDDQAAAVKQLAARGIVVDTQRVGIFGWSYGGYLSALAALRMPSVFTCAVVGAPVTSWDGYDTAYTERYMGTPSQDAKAYEASSCLNADLWSSCPSPMLIIHGGLDENVHFRHTARLVQMLTKKRVKHELMLFPQERHLPRDADGRAYTEGRVLDFLTQHLLAR
jgi:dipeptidyl-peptidase 4